MTAGKSPNKLVDVPLRGVLQYYVASRKDINMRVPDEVRQCVVFIGLPINPPDGGQALAFHGTAFFVSVPSESVEGWQYVYLVTAKHVAVKLEGKPLLVRVNTKGGGSASFSGQGARWWYHPTDLSIDVAVIPWAPPEQVDYRHIPAQMFLTDEISRSKSIGTGDEVFITGLFAHLTGRQRNLPIVRMGSIAMMPGEPVPTREFGDMDAYLIEARSIGGLSGSPAFVRETIPLGIGAFYLLGLMHGHWDIPPSAKNDAVTPDDDGSGAVNMGIAIVIPAKKVMEVIQQPGLVEMRQKADGERRRQIMPTLDEGKQKAADQSKPKEDGTASI